MLLGFGSLGHETIGTCPPPIKHSSTSPKPIGKLKKALEITLVALQYVCPVRNHPPVQAFRNIVLDVC